MTIEEILQAGRPEGDIINDLKTKVIIVPGWLGKDGLKQQYNAAEHPVNNKAIYPDVTDEDGRLEPVTRITYDLQKLAVRRIVEMCCGIPVKRIFSPENDKQKEVAEALEKIYMRNRIDSVNNERLTMLYASCEVVTLWYAVEKENKYYGFKSPLVFRCMNYTPMQGDELYPLFDEFGDLIALSVSYQRKVGKKRVRYFDTFTATQHLRWINEGAAWQRIVTEDISIGKIPGVYMFRPTPGWEGKEMSNIVYEMEWAMSRNGNYLRKNAKPVFGIFADEEIQYGKEQNQDKEFRSIVQYPKGSDAKYITWEQATEALKFQINELRQSFFTQLQLPDWSYEKMSQQALSGESRKQLFIDAQLKVKDESGRQLEFYDREVNVLKAMLKQVMDKSYWDDIDALPVENVITPFTITDEKDTISNLLLANGNKALMSQKESIEMLGWSSNPDETYKEITEESKADAFALTE